MKIFFTPKREIYSISTTTAATSLLIFPWHRPFPPSNLSLWSRFFIPLNFQPIFAQHFFTPFTKSSSMIRFIHRICSKDYSSGRIYGDAPCCNIKLSPHFAHYFKLQPFRSLQKVFQKGSIKSLKNNQHIKNLTGVSPPLLTITKILVPFWMLHGSHMNFLAPVIHSENPSISFLRHFQSCMPQIIVHPTSHTAL